MKLRTLKRLTVARLLHEARWHAELRAELMIEDWPDDWNNDDDAAACDHCGGDGFDPMADYLLPCPRCLGDA